MVFPKHPLGFVKQGLAEIGHELSYVYEDLVFPDHTAYLIQFGKENYELNIYLNGECNGEEEAALTEELTTVMAGSIGFSLNFAGHFSLESDEASEEMNISFF